MVKKEESSEPVRTLNATTEGVEVDKNSASAVEAVGDSGAPSGDESAKTYDEDYVKGLRDEAATARVKAKRSEVAEGLLRKSVIRDAVRDLLADPTDLEWSDEFADEDGWPVVEKIQDAAQELIAAKPHLGRPRGDIGQGQRGDDHDAFSLSALLKAGA